jgi:hypothetical protein
VSFGAKNLEKQSCSEHASSASTHTAQRYGILAKITWLIVNFGEHQMIAQLIAKRVLIFPLINKDLRDCYPLFVRGNFASVNLNHQK